MLFVYVPLTVDVHNDEYEEHHTHTWIGNGTSIDLGWFGHSVVRFNNLLIMNIHETIRDCDAYTCL